MHLSASDGLPHQVINTFDIQPMELAVRWYGLGTESEPPQALDGPCGESGALMKGVIFADDQTLLHALEELRGAAGPAATAPTSHYHLYYSIEVSTGADRQVAVREGAQRLRQAAARHAAIERLERLSGGGAPGTALERQRGGSRDDEMGAPRDGSRYESRDYEMSEPPEEGDEDEDEDEEAEMKRAIELSLRDAGGGTDDGGPDGVGGSVGDGGGGDGGDGGDGGGGGGGGDDDIIIPLGRHSDAASSAANLPICRQSAAVEAAAALVRAAAVAADARPALPPVQRVSSMPLVSQTPLTLPSVAEVAALRAEFRQMACMPQLAAGWVDEDEDEAQAEGGGAHDGARTRVATLEMAREAAQDSAFAEEQQQCADAIMLLWLLERRLHLGSLGARHDALDAARASDTSVASLFVSARLSEKLTMQLRHSLWVVSGALPKWLPVLVHRCPTLFSHHSRAMYVRASAFGTSRALHWTQMEAVAELRTAYTVEKDMLEAAVAAALPSHLGLPSGAMAALAAIGGGGRGERVSRVIFDVQVSVAECC